MKCFNLFFDAAAVVFLTLFNRFVLHDIIARDGLLRYVPPDWVSGSRGFVIAVLGGIAFIVVNGAAFCWARRELRARGGRFSRLLG
ncbi:hypothetical protein MAF45_00730 [Mesosutterella sp. OilRF-GAM-744-9]|uniref:Uncharacterized protein n=1 Tax=Mesosutterella porci TaxID=2915351 RepID=A0ABS9MMY1_9BURK|nr:hypothetical protein [Mesosutterella sp. oilRF-744-WT-GAM-9]MCG5029981.1 hypothetical protein [Mesosutterella sp. oilRF-744-WT-GAM-9]MCI6531098.1 hypothetical protein [Mesosutterella sp.]